MKDLSSFDEPNALQNKLLEQRIKALPDYQSWQRKLNLNQQKRIKPSYKNFFDRPYVFACLFKATVILVTYFFFYLPQQAKQEHRYDINAPYVFDIKHGQSYPTDQKILEIFSMGECDTKSIHEIKSKLAGKGLNYKQYELQNDFNAGTRLYHYLEGTRQQAGFKGPAFIINNKIILYNKHAAEQIAWFSQR